MLKGSCLCNGIQYEIDSDLGTIMQCHCQKCRKANGSAFAANAPIPTQSFKYIKGEALTSEFESTAGVFRVFCSRCASPLYSRRPGEPDVLRLRIGTLDTALTTKPAMHIFVGSKAEWSEVTDNIPQYDERPNS